MTFLNPQWRPCCFWHAINQRAVNLLVHTSYMTFVVKFLAKNSSLVSLWWKPSDYFSRVCWAMRELLQPPHDRTRCDTHNSKHREVRIVARKVRYDMAAKLMVRFGPVLRPLNPSQSWARCLAVCTTKIKQFHVSSPNDLLYYYPFLGCIVDGEFIHISNMCVSMCVCCL